MTFLLVKCLKSSLFFYNKRLLQTIPQGLEAFPSYVQLSEAFSQDSVDGAESLIRSIVVYEDFISPTEENSLLSEIEPYLKRLRYEFDHWDDAIHGYRETERSVWNDKNTQILNRIRSRAFSPDVIILKDVHVLDLNKEGYIKPHIDAVRFCGDTITGLSLLSTSVMRLVNDKNKKLWADILLKRRSLYVMKGAARFDYTHEILKKEHSKFNNEIIERERRISVICRNEPTVTE